MRFAYFLSFAAAIIALVCIGVSDAKARPPIEAYGALPDIRLAALSPDGEHIAFIARTDESEILMVLNVDGSPVAGVQTDKINARRIQFATPDHVLLTVSKATGVAGFQGRFEYSATFSYNIQTKEIQQLLYRADDLYPAQSGLGRVVGVSSDKKHLYMPAFEGLEQYPSYDLFRAKIEGRGGRSIRRGTHHTVDWFVGRDGEVLAREDYNNQTNKYHIRTRRNGKWETVYEEVTSRIPFNLVGVSPDNASLIVSSRSGLSNYSRIRELSFDGTFSRPLFQHDNREVDSVILNIQREFFGVRTSGFFPQYEFLDSNLRAVVIAVQNFFETDAVSLVSWSDDFESLLFYVEGSTSAGEYYFFNRSRSALQKLGSARTDIGSDDIGPIQVIEYKARDGLTIPALLTLPPDGGDQNLPLIVMPHGGPESYDAVGFNWRAQYFANRGYLVFQPNFRGSDGFGAAFRDAGRGEWGGKMQDDITDGVRALIRSGRADADRICIIGASYGGYAALAGGAFTPDLYKCVGAIAPVADLPLMLSQERRDHGSRHWVYDYWTELIGDPRSEKAHLRSISPVNAASAFTAPVLLIHGKDDLVVPIVQSRRMKRALEKAGKPVELVELKGEDHYLSSSDTRLATLVALDQFVREHIGANPED
ncbi:MAG: prolyl oligopeptidase family serine peptidase [Pseudomonadota bacterium]